MEKEHTCHRCREIYIPYPSMTVAIYSSGILAWEVAGQWRVLGEEKGLLTP